MGASKRQGSAFRSCGEDPGGAAAPDRHIMMRAGGGQAVPTSRRRRRRRRDFTIPAGSTVAPPPHARGTPWLAALQTGHTRPLVEWAFLFPT